MGVSAGLPPASARPPSVGRAAGLYTSLRLLLFLLSWLVLVLLGVEGLLAAAAAVLVSSIVALVVLRPQRAMLAAAMAARAEQRTAEQADARARLDDGS